MGLKVSLRNLKGNFLSASIGRTRRTEKEGSCGREGFHGSDLVQEHTRDILRTRMWRHCILVDRSCLHQACSRLQASLGCRRRWTTFHVVHRMHASTRSDEANILDMTSFLQEEEHTHL